MKDRHVRVFADCRVARDPSRDIDAETSRQRDHIESRAQRRGFVIVAPYTGQTSGEGEK
jgi:hypothetical protein